MSNMSRHGRAAILELCERRTLFADIWGTAPSLINVDELAAQYPQITGTGQTIALIDTGIDYTHPDLGGGFGAGFKVIGGYDFHDNDTDPLDTDGHGTGVAGVIAASTFQVNGFTYRGLAPDANLVALRIAQNTSDVPLEKIEAALTWVLDHAEELGITVVNLSFGYGRFDSYFSDQTLEDELEQLQDAGIAFVSSAGNGGTNDGIGVTAPAADASAFSVGSVSGSDIISEFSQRSRHLTLLAVGEDVRTTMLGGVYQQVDGTSFAAPAVAGAIALMRQVDPTFTLGDIRSMLRASMPKNIDGDQETGVTSGFTFQRLDALAAVTAASLRKAAAVDVQPLVGKSGNENDIAVDSLGVMHFVYYDNDARTMKYATRSLNRSWSTPVTIDTSRSDVGTEFSLKLDSFGAARLAYLDGPNGDLKFARLVGSQWLTEHLDTSGVTGLYPSLEIDDDDNYWIAYLRKTKFDLRVMHFDGSVWGRQTIDTDGNVGYSASITLDQSDRPAVVYGNASYKQLKFAQLNSSNEWMIDVVEQGVLGTSYLSLAFDVENRPHVSYYEISTADLKYASFSGVEWVVERVYSRGATGLYTNLQLDDDGNPRIAFWDKRTNSLNKAAYDGSAWRISRVAANAGKFMSATISAATGTWLTESNRDNFLVLIVVS